MNITYLFGAGASYNAIPIVGELEIAFERMAKWAEMQLDADMHFESNTDVKNGYKLFVEQLRQCAHRAKVFGTIDTYAKKLSISESELDLNMLKATLSLFFTIWQDNQIKTTDLTDVRKVKEFTINPKGFQDIDSRYFGLLTNYLENKQNRIVFKDNVKFLTWNYDTQIERALALITDRDLSSVFENYDIYPAIKEIENNPPSIIHLNGISGFYESKASIVNLSKEANPEGGTNLKKLIRDNLYFMDSTSKLNINLGNCFNFAWEKNEKSKKARDYAKQVLSKTDILVVIGYSFPTFNDEIDQELFNELKKSGKNFKIYYQDLNANENLISQRFGIPIERIKIDTQNLKQFILPLDSHNFNKEE